MTEPLSPPTRLGLHLVGGALLLIAAAWLFGAIAEDVVTSDRLTLQDAQLAQWLHAHGNATLTHFMLVVSNLHSTVAMSSYTAVVAVFLALRRRWRWLILVVICSGGGLALNVAMKLAFHRARPVFDDPLLTLTSYSFPSGHVAASTIFYGLVVCWIFTRTPQPMARAWAVGAALLLISLVAFSRMYLGVHYLSDVGAAFAEGVAWLSLCLGGLAAYWRPSSAAA